MMQVLGQLHEGVAALMPRAPALLQYLLPFCFVVRCISVSAPFLPGVLSLPGVVPAGGISGAGCVPESGALRLLYVAPEKLSSSWW